MSNNIPRFSPLFLILASLFITLLLISNITAGKLALFFGITLPAAVLLFPLTYIFGDVLTEVYGFYRTRLVIWIGLGANLVMVLAFMITLALPYPDFWNARGLCNCSGFNSPVGRRFFSRLSDGGVLQCNGFIQIED